MPSERKKTKGTSTSDDDILNSDETKSNGRTGILSDIVSIKHQLLSTNEPFCALSSKKRVLVERIIQRIICFSTVEGFTESEILEVLDAAYKQLLPLPLLIQVSVPVVIFGDIHGQLADLQRFLAIVGSPPRTKFLFLGDYVDRCNKSLEVALLLLCYKLRYPAQVDMLRGNHECAKMNRIYGFYAECRSKFSVMVWKAFQRVFDELPLCARVGRRILSMHGGISPDIQDWDSLKILKKPHTSKECDEGICVDLMWSDPSRDDCTKGFQPNTDRGTSYLFGDDMVRNFNCKLDIDLVVRAHEVVKKGHLFNASYQMCTIFSAPNYCGSEGNCASVMLVSKQLEISFVTLKPRSNTTTQSTMSKNDLLVMQERFNRANAKSPKPGTEHNDSAFVIQNNSRPLSGDTMRKKKGRDKQNGSAETVENNSKPGSLETIPNQFDAPLTTKSLVPLSSIQAANADTTAITDETLKDFAVDIAQPSSPVRDTTDTVTVKDESSDTIASSLSTTGETADATAPDSTDSSFSTKNTKKVPTSIDLAAPIPSLSLSTESSSTKTIEEKATEKKQPPAADETKNSTR